MERYYEKIDEEFEEQELVLESLLYEIDLISTFGIATEDGDSTLVTKNAPTGNTADGKTGNTAVDNINKASNTASGVGDDANKEADKSKDQTNNKADSKMRQNMIANIKKVSDAIMEFVNKHLTDMRIGISTMLNDNANTVKELNDIMANKKPDLNLTVKDYNYNDEFVNTYSAGLNKAFDQYTQQTAAVRDVIRKFREVAANNSTEDIDDIANSMMSIVKNEDTGKEHLTVNTTRSYEGKIESPTVLIARNLKVSNPETIKIGDLKKFIYNSYKGLSDKQTEPPVFKLQNNTHALDSAIAFIRNYKRQLQELNTTMDKIKNNASVYKDICEAGRNIELVNEKINSAFNALMNKMSRDLNEFVSYSDYFITILKERAISAEFIIRKAYGSEVKVKNQKPKNAEPPIDKSHIGKRVPGNNRGDEV